MAARAAGDTYEAIDLHLEAADHFNEASEGYYRATLAYGALAVILLLLTVAMAVLFV